DKLIAYSEVIAGIRRHVAVVEFMQISGGVRMQYRCRRILGGPNDPVSRAVRRNAGSRSRIGKTVWTGRGGRGNHSGVGEGISPYDVVYGPVIDPVVEKGRRGKDRAGETACNYVLPDVISRAVELAHVVAVDDIDMTIFTRTHAKVANNARRIGHIHQYHRS